MWTKAKDLIKIKIWLRLYYFVHTFQGTSSEWCYSQCPSSFWWSYSLPTNMTETIYCKSHLLFTCRNFVFSNFMWKVLLLQKMVVVVGEGACCFILHDHLRDFTFRKSSLTIKFLIIWTFKYLFLKYLLRWSNVGQML